MPLKSNLVTSAFYWITYRGRKDSKAAELPRPTPAGVTTHKTGDLEHAAQPAGSLDSWSVPSRHLGWSLPLPGSSAYVW